MQKLKILIADDDSLMRETLGGVFMEEGFEVETAENGLAAINLIDLKKFIPDVVLTGVTMSPMNGFEMIEAMQKNESTRDISFVIMSHRGREEDKEKAMSLGVKDFIISGITTPRESVNRVRKILYMEKSYRVDVKFNLGDNDSSKFIHDNPQFFLFGQNTATILLKTDIQQNKNVFIATFYENFEDINTKKKPDDDTKS